MKPTPITGATSAKPEGVLRDSNKDAARAKAIALLVDEIGDLKNLLGPFAPKLVRLDAAQRELRGHYDAAAPAEPFEAVGARYVALVGPKTKKRLIDYAALWKLAGVSVMKKLATVTLAAVEQHFGPEAAARITAEELSGPRTLKVFARQNGAVKDEKAA
jgi:hypothetical protein